MSFDAATKQQFCFEYQTKTAATAPAASKDSGIMATIDPQNRNLPTNCSATIVDIWRSGITTPTNTVFGLKDGTDGEILNEATSKKADGSLVAASSRHHKDYFSKKAPVSNESKTLTDITNRNDDEESPKSHLMRPTRLHEFNFNVNKRTTKVLSTDKNLNTRKRNLDVEPTMKIIPKRRKFGKCSVDKLHNDTTTISSSNVRSQQSSLHLFLRVQPSSSVETTNFPRSPKIALPQFLHVEYSLETVSKPQIESVAFKSVSGKVVAELMCSMSEKEFSRKYILVDCRYPYEYNGGHLRGAINIYDVAQVPEVFFPDSEEQFRETSSKIPIFYCEYSQKRGPTMAHALRQADRKRNEDRYPEVDYKEIYLLDRGYKKFFEEDRFVHLCEPRSYTKMIASSHKEDLKRYQLHKSKSISNITTSIFSDTKRDLLKVRTRFWDDIDETTSPDKKCTAIASSSSLPCPCRSPPNRKPCRGNIFGSPFSPQPSKCGQTPEKIPLKPLRFDSYS